MVHNRYPRGLLHHDKFLPRTFCQTCIIYGVVLTPWTFIKKASPLGNDRFKVASVWLGWKSEQIIRMYCKGLHGI